ncbi:PepSY domain-containing protein [Paracoccus sediminicola]|uniref:PepSY domain-containing protein n=1 Tax=Paracoccus sediminicola TaxID=3017783 RepID=UPI0022F07845|nr:PepSY domain-containing protein [Paracoccus sediminicola]WBU55591.1 hypothetical protein PAF18_08605 [Paracoccus sediminicola]
MKFAAAFASAALLAAPAFAQDEETMSLEEVAAAAMEAAQAAMPDASFESASLDDDEGTDTYEIAGVTSDGTAIEVDVLEDGTVEEIEEEVALEDLPDAVTAAWEENMAGVTPSMIEKSTRDDGATVIYEFEGEQDGQEFDAEVNEDGSNWTMTEDMAG